MSAKQLLGKPVAEKILADALDLSKSLHHPPGLTVVLVGNDPASSTYVASKTKKCEALGFRGKTLALKESTTETELLSIVQELNENREVDGILVQLPLPSHIHKHTIFSAIAPAKDVDCLNPTNVGMLAQDRAHWAPCTPSGIIEMLRFYETQLSGAEAVVIGRSEIVGKPMAQLLLREHATVTICHSKTKDLKQHTKRADILIAALGQPEAITAEHIRPGAVVVDVGIHRKNGTLVGDVHAASVSEKALALSPVPGGVGPLTIAMLMKNLVTAASLKQRF